MNFQMHLLVRSTLGSKERSESYITKWQVFDLHYYYSRNSSYCWRWSYSMRFSTSLTLTLICLVKIFFVFKVTQILVTTLHIDSNFFVCGTGAWTQGLHLEPVYQSFLVKGFFGDRVLQTFCQGWLWTVSLLISASWVARITGVSHHWHSAA
jgi:hypothetical protein